MAFNSLSGTVVVHPGSHLDASGSAITATSLYTSGSKGAVYEEAGIKTYTCTDSKQWVSCSGSLLTSSLSTITLVCVDPPNTNLILTSDDIHNISPSGSINIGPAGATRTSPTFLQFSGTLAFADHSYSGSYYSASCGTRTVDACTTVLTTTDGESTISVSGSLLSGSGGTTEIVGGSTTHSGTLGYSTFSTSGSYTIGTAGVTTTSPGVISSSATSTLYGLTTHAVAATAVTATSLSSSGDLQVGTSALFANSAAAISNTGAGSFQGVVSTTVTASSTLQVAGAITAGNGKFTVSNEAIVAATSLSASNTLGGLDLVLDAGGTGKIGVTGDLDLMTLTANKVAVAGVVSGSSTATLYNLETHQVDAVTLRGSGHLLQNMTGSGANVITVSQALDGAALSQGLNYFTASTNPVTVRVPSASYGDRVVVKASSGVTATNYIKITGTIAIWGESGAIDGQADIKITSPYGSVALVYVRDSDWRIV